MPVVAVNIALIFPITPELRAANQYLLSKQPSSFSYDINHKPHLTLLQDVVENTPEAIERLAAAVSSALKHCQIPESVHFHALSTNEGLSPSLLPDDPSQKIMALHRALLQYTAPSVRTRHDTPIPNNAFFEAPSPSGVNHVKHFRRRHAGSNYDPHLTLGKGNGIERTRLEDLLQLPVTLQTQGIVMAQLGRSGTVSDNIFAKW